MGKRSANSIDKHVAGKIRARREHLKVSQESLGDVLGVTYQQVQKIEAAANRISAGNLWKVAQALSKPISYFYEGLPT